MLLGDGFDVETVHAWHSPMPDSHFDLVVVLGAPQSANDDLPYLQAEQDLIRQSIKRETPVLGICLGSQLIARALGGRVYRGHKKEIGFYEDLEVTGAGGLFSGFSNPFVAFHWHEDTFDLPDGAVRLASSREYQNQAFRHGCAVGLQFHLEVTEEMVRAWLCAQGSPYDKAIMNPDTILGDARSRMQQVRSNMRRFYGNLKSEFDL